MLLRRADSALILIDVQEKLFPAMAEAESMRRKAALLLRVANRLSVPVLATEQYPEGLGHTLPELARLVAKAATIDKRHFDAVQAPGFLGRAKGLGRGTLVLAGIEAHVCVLQTALGLKAAGFRVAVAGDAVASRDPADRQAALARLAGNGIECVSAEMAVFEWLGEAPTAEFRDILAWLK